MSLVLKKVSTFKWKVPLKVPGNGAYEVSEVEFEFKKLKVSELEDSMKKFNESGGKYADFCKKVIVGWSGIKDEAGADVNFSPENLELLFNEGTFGVQIFDSYFEIVNGAAAKN